jgi:1-acyl-sn-glycerol-3-phosphate acyltransferase
VIRTTWVLLKGAVLTAVLAAGVLFHAWFRRRNLPCVCERYPRLWAKTILRWSGARIEVEGMERVDWERPMILVSNHQSWFDVFALVATIPAKLRFVAKEELSRIPIFGGAWRACGHVSVNRADRDDAIASLERAGARIRDESLAVIFFPEGTRSPDGELKRFKKGAFVLAIQTGTPVIPLGIAGTREIMPKGSFRIRPGRIRIVMGDPIPTRGLTHGDRHGLLERAHAAVASLMELAARGRNDEIGPLEPEREEAVE